MLLIDCTDCFTRVEFKNNVVETSFEAIENVLIDNKDSIRMFMIHDYVFEFIEYVKEGEKNCSANCSDLVHWIIGKYITPIPHIMYMSDEEIWFKITPESVNEFTFFFNDEAVISMHGMLFYEGECVENLVHRFNIDEIKSLNNKLCDYIVKNHNKEKKPINIWSPFKCIGIYNEKAAKND